MQKRFALRIIKVVLFLCIFLAVYSYLDKVLERKKSFTKNGAFLEEENNFDVLYFGASHVYDAIYPMELWNHYGIFSYNLANPNNTLSASYWGLVNALDYTTPRLVVVDCSMLSKETKVIEDKESQLHNTFDVFPLSANKMNAVYDLIEPKERIGFLWKFALYHSRWNQLSKEEFMPQAEPHKGADLPVNVAIPGTKSVVNPKEKSPADTVGAQYMRKIIELCQERDIDVLLTYMPFPAEKDKLKEANLAYDIAEEYNIQYLNFQEIDGIIDYDTDCFDSNSHLNVSGARKVTEYLGAYIQGNYGISDRREDTSYASWHEDYTEYTEYKLKLIQEQYSLDCELILHYDKNLSTCLYVKEDSEILQDERMVKLIQNISPYTELSQIETAILNKSEYFLVVDNGWCDIRESVDGQPLEDVNTTFGNLTYTSDGEAPSLLIQNTEENFLTGVNEAGKVPDVQIITINKMTGEIVARASYVVNGYDSYGNVTANKIS